MRPSARMEGADSLRNGGRDGMGNNPGDGHTVWSRSSPPSWIESTIKSAFTWRKRFRSMVALMRTWSASRKETMSRVATAVPFWAMQSTHSLSVPGGARKRRLSVGQWAHNSLLTRWSLSCSSLNRYGCYRVIRHPGDEDEGARWACRATQQRRSVEIASGPAPAVLCLMHTCLSASNGGGIFLLLSWLARLAGLPNRRVPADRSPARTDDGRVVRDFKLELTAREV